MFFFSYSNNRSSSILWCLHCEKCLFKMSLKSNYQYNWNNAIPLSKYWRNDQYQYLTNKQIVNLLFCVFFVRFFDVPNKSIKATAKLLSFIISTLILHRHSNMKNYSIISFLLYLLLVCVIRETLSINSNKFLSDSNNGCQMSNALYWRTIQWFYGPLKFVDVYILTKTTTTRSMNQLANYFLEQIEYSEYCYFRIENTNISLWK